MKKFLRERDCRCATDKSRTKRKWVLIFIGLFLIGGGSLYASDYWLFVEWYWVRFFHHIDSPLEEPIRLSHQGLVLEKEFNVEKACIYPFDILFYPNTDGWDDLVNLVQGENYKGGILLPVSLVVEKRERSAWNPIMHITINTENISGSKSKHFLYRRLDARYLQSGTYKIKLYNIREAGEFNGVKTVFKINDVESYCNYNGAYDNAHLIGGMQMLMSEETGSQHKQEAVRAFSKESELFPEANRESILAGKITLGMNPMEAMLAGGKSYHSITPDRYIWSKDYDPYALLKAQVLNPDDSKIEMFFRNNTQFAWGDLLFKVKFKSGRVDRIEFFQPVE